MISVDITWSPNNAKNHKNEFCGGGDPAFMQCHRLNMHDFAQLIALVPVVDNQTWLHNAQVMARRTMTCEIDHLIADAQQILKRAKEDIRKKHPIRYRMEFFKQIAKNPVLSFKSVILIWGPQKLKDRICQTSR